jgi:predicted  nucleic acid-binding Zn-ribbon protein
MKKIILFALFIGLLAPGCALDRREYEELKATQEEFRAQLAELRQANETINRNIAAAIQELDALRAQLAAIPPRVRRTN